MKKLLVLAALVASGIMASQRLDAARERQDAAVFEVASIKRNTSGEGFILMGMQPGGRLTMVNVPARQLIVRAYQVQPYQVFGGPSWITSDRFDVTAKAETDASPQQLNLMLQALLADRFKLKVRRETRESDVFRLVKARADGKLGDAIRPSAARCEMGRSGPGQPGRGAADVPGPRAGGPQSGPAGPLGDCQFMMSPGQFQVNGQSMKTFAEALGRQVGRPVIDETGLSGWYDFTLTFMPDPGGRGMPPGVPPPGAPELPPIDPNAPALPTALQEQLALKLESGRGPVEMIVIDRIELPSED